MHFERIKLCYVNINSVHFVVVFVVAKCRKVTGPPIFYLVALILFNHADKES